MQLRTAIAAFLFLSFFQGCLLQAAVDSNEVDVQVDEKYIDSLRIFQKCVIIEASVHQTKENKVTHFLENSSISSMSIFFKQ